MDNYKTREQAWLMLAGCDGICVSAADLGVGPSDQIAYPHPGCMLHGEPENSCRACEGWGSFAGDYNSPPGVNDARKCEDCNGTGYAPQV